MILVETKPEIGARCHCAEWVPALLAGEIDLPREVRRMSLDSLECRAGDQRATARVKGWVIDRPAWERHTASRVLWWGVSMVCGARAKGFDGKGRLIIQGRNKFVKIEAAVVVAADGAPFGNGQGRRAAPPGGSAGAATGAGCRSRRAKANRSLPARSGGLSSGASPKGGTMNIGLGGRSLGQASLHEMLGQWQDELRAEGLVGDGMVRRGGGWLPGGGMRRAVHELGGGTMLLLAGDAAGLTHPTTGAGIPQAVISGRLAGEAAAAMANGEAGAASQYEAELTGRFGGYISRGAEALTQAMALWPDDFIKAVKTLLAPVAPAGRGR